MPISHHHSKRSRERSPSKKRSRSRSRSSRRKRSRTQSPRPGPSKDCHSVSSESGASSSARAHRDREVTPEGARFLVQAQQASDERLFMLESEVKRSSEEYNVISSKPKHKFNKKSMVISTSLTSKYLPFYVRLYCLGMNWINRRILMKV